MLGLVYMNVLLPLLHYGMDKVYSCTGIGIDNYLQRPFCW